jgi:hypothetical protein
MAVPAKSAGREGAAPRRAAPHAGRVVFFAYAVLGAVCTISGPYTAITLPVPLTIGMAVLQVGVGLWIFGLGVYGLAAGRAVQAVNTSLNLIGQGKLREAEALLDAVGSSRVRNVQRVALVQRALIALRRGDLTGAAAACDAAVRVPLGLWNVVHAVLHQTNAHGIRALVRASSGDAPGARSDIGEVRRDPHAPPQALARAALAEALLLEKEGDRGALASLLGRERRLLLDATEPRERAIVRGLQRLVRAPKTGVYRQPAHAPRLAEGAEEPALADWMLAVAPDVVPFVRPRPQSDAAAAHTPEARSSTAAAGTFAASAETAERFAPNEHARAAIRQARERAAREAARGALSRQRWNIALLTAMLVVLGVGLAFTFGALPEPEMLLPGADAQEGSSADSTVWLLLPAASLYALAMLTVAVRVRRARRDTRKLTAVATRILRGDHEGAARALAPLVKSSNAFVAAQAELYAAALAERRADFEGALARCDAALGRLSRYAARVLASDLLLPEIISARAGALAALGRADEAAAEIAALPPAYPFLARARFRTELIALARRGDLAGAAKVAARAPIDLPIGPRDELLRDVVRAAASPETAGSAEIERLRDELRAEPDHRAWLDAVAPGLLAAFDRATTADATEAAHAESAPSSAPVRAESTAPGDHDAEARAVAEAEAELEADLAAPAKRSRA